MYLTDGRYRILQRLLEKLRLCGTDDLSTSSANGPQAVDVLSHRSEEAQRRFLAPLPMPRMEGYAPLAFGVAWLVEGLISHGIILPFEASVLVRALEASCPTRAGGRGVQERILGSMFNEERIKDVEAYVRSKSVAWRLSRVMLMTEW
jgi:hypothetical protein